MTIPVSTLSTLDFEKSDRYEVFRESLAPLFLAEMPQGQRDFSGQATLYLVRDIVFAYTQFDALNFRLDQQWQKRYESDCVLIQVYTKGGYQGVVNGDVVRVPSGTISLLDLRFPLHTCAAESAVFTLVIPRYYFEASAVPPSGSLLAPSSAAAKVLVNQCLLLWQTMTDMNSTEIFPLLKHLVFAIVDVMLESCAVGLTAVNGCRLTIVLSYIDAHLTDGDALTETVVCQRFGCSRATLYRWFSVYGGYRAFIRKRLLSFIYANILTNPNGAISALAYRYGFISLAHFSRVFKQAFSITPSQLARQARADKHCVHHSNRFSSSPKYRDWLLQV